MQLTVGVVFTPLVGAIVAGLLGKQLGRRGTHMLTTLGVAIAFVLASYLAYLVFSQNLNYNANLYTWLASGAFTFQVGVLLDPLSVTMLVVVTFISFLVHIYSIGYMHGDPGYQRFFSYISFFTFAMLLLVSANNFLQMFIGWEAVGLASYLLIGFWFQRESATIGSFKAFIVNRVGDFGFLLGMAGLVAYFGTLDFQQIFVQAPILAITQQTISLFPGIEWSVLTVISLLLFVGAMGKSAQIPLHVWLPESMEGPTPISALIHAATMVTAGIFMVARMSPLYELSQTALSIILVIGSTGAVFLGLVGIVKNDIKRVIAYSTLSQLGYMVAALGVSAYAAGLFHLVTHAFFKALLFLAAGSVIIGMHHEQDMRKMGGLSKRMPITHAMFLIGALSLSGIPFFSGFYSKDVIIEAIQHAQIPGATYAYYCVLLGAFITAFYSFRAFFLTFHTSPRMDLSAYQSIQESPWVIWLPLVILAIPSIGLGYIAIGPLVFDQPSLLASSLFVAPHHDALEAVASSYQGPLAMALHAFKTPVFWLAVAGIAAAWFAYVKYPKIPHWTVQRLNWLYQILIYRYGFDGLYHVLFVRGVRWLSRILAQRIDLGVIDGCAVNGTGRLVMRLSAWLRRTQTGYLYFYAYTMVLGLAAFLIWFIFLSKSA